MVEGEALPLGAHRVGQFGDGVIEAGQGDAAVVVMQAGQKAGQDVDRVGGEAAVAARMQVLVGGMDRELGLHHAAQLGDDGRGRVVEQAGVADQRDVGGQFLRVLPAGRERARASRIPLRPRRRS